MIDFNSASHAIPAWHILHTVPFSMLRPLLSASTSAWWIVVHHAAGCTGPERLVLYAVLLFFSEPGLFVPQPPAQSGNMLLFLQATQIQRD
jgi:hypothetical protein